MKRTPRGERPQRGRRPQRGAVPRDPQPTAPGKGRTAAGARPASRSARRVAGARARPRLGLPRLGLPRLRIRATGAARMLALLLAVLSVAGIVLAVNGPWLRVSSVSWTGVQFTRDDVVATILDPVRGTSLLAVDGERLVARLRKLPAIADASVEGRLPNAVRVQLHEKSPTFVWQTIAVQLLGAGDGTLIGEVARADALSPALAELPFINDSRAVARNMAEGYRIPAALLAIAVRLNGILPAALGSSSASLSVSLDDACGFVVSSARPAWRAVFGLSDRDQAGAVGSRIAAQAAAVRTLFAAHPEATVRWVDVRNPGKVYWRPNGPGGSEPC